MYTEHSVDSRWRQALGAVESYKMKRGLVFGSIIIAALLAFELFNYTTTDFALTDLLGDMRFLGLRWAMILSLAFCGMDFAGIARLFTPEKGRGDQLEVWYLLGAWFLAATMNAMLTWWGVSIALLTHDSLGNEILSRQQLLNIVPVFVAALVWLIRVLMIGTFSLAGDRLFTQAEETLRQQTAAARPVKSAPKSPARPARTIGAEDDDDDYYYDQRPRSVPDTHTRAPRPAMAASMSAVRPAPKPSAKYTSNGNGGAARAPNAPGHYGSRDRN